MYRLTNPPPPHITMSRSPLFKHWRGIGLDPILLSIFRALGTTRRRLAAEYVSHGYIQICPGLTLSSANQHRTSARVPQFDVIYYKRSKLVLRWGIPLPQPTDHNKVPYDNLRRMKYSVIRSHVTTTMTNSDQA